MREHTVTITVYTFDELSDSAKQTAIGELQLNCPYDDWWECVYEDAAMIGLVIEEFDIGRGAFCRGKWTEDAEDTARLILENHGGVCETHRDALSFQEELGRAQQIFVPNDGAWADVQIFEETDDYQELCEEFQRTICEDYRIMLQKEYEYLTSEESIIETIEANEYEFTADGKLY